MSQPKASTAVESISSLPVIDEEVLAFLSQDLGESMMPSLVETLLTELDTLVASLKACFDRADFGAAAEHAHSLKGTAATFGATRLVATAQGIELAGPHLTAEAAEQRLQELKQHTNQVAEALQRRYPSASQPTIAD
jgi:HPt (histidine-containing phosphotransfer) domain-containing protein